ncbi:MAG: nucleotide exchange factor GrpE [Candidatus Izemoplasmatales bacterium]|jgi:molecular chaperone GrpE
MPDKEKKQDNVPVAETIPETKKPEEGKKEQPKKKKKDTVEEQLELIKEELTEIKDKYLRTLAEAENLKKRTSEELKRERKYAGMQLCDKLIDQLEVFDQALNIQTEDKQLQSFLQGFKMIKDMLYQSLESEGVKALDTKVGAEFDPNYEHAFDTRYEPDKPEHTILEILKKGYLYKDRLLRAALVIINIKPETMQKDNNEEIGDNVA